MLPYPTPLLVLNALSSYLRWESTHLGSSAVLKVGVERQHKSTYPPARAVDVSNYPPCRPATYRQQTRPCLPITFALDASISFEVGLLHAIVTKAGWFLTGDIGQRNEVGELKAYIAQAFECLKAISKFPALIPNFCVYSTQDMSLSASSARESLSTSQSSDFVANLCINTSPDTPPPIAIHRPAQIQSHTCPQDPGRLACQLCTDT
ncbi:hypothetical protein BJ912DRAFT_1063429 [Pholiota molesta]|nr:hypothetical protein BJ912DRAFT_1063429 [Pholiota molesta]